MYMGIALIPCSPQPLPLPISFPPSPSPSISSCNINVVIFSRVCFVGSREGHLPMSVSLISQTRMTPMPAVIIQVTIHCNCCMSGSISNYVMQCVFNTCVDNEIISYMIETFKKMVCLTQFYIIVLYQQILFCTYNLKKFNICKFCYLSLSDFMVYFTK